MPCFLYADEANIKLRANLEFVFSSRKVGMSRLKRLKDDGPICQPRPRPIPIPFDRTIPWDGEPNDDPDDRGCGRQYAADQTVCGRIEYSQMRGACYAHARDRYYSCKTGRNIPYNPWPNYPWE